LFFSAGEIGIKIPFAEAQIIEATKEVVRKNNLKECYIRPLVFYGYGKMGLDTVGATVDVGIAAWPWGAYLGKEGIEKGVSVKISPFVRPPREMMPTHAKVSGNYANSILAKMDALNTGYKEAVLLDKKGNISECSGENIFIVSKGNLLAPTTGNTLDGITRKSVIKIAEDMGIKVFEKNISKKQFFSADEAFMTGTAAELTPINHVDGEPIGEGIAGEITKKIQAKYSEIIHGKDSSYLEWLDFVE
jgi:branched-chain amino acid aminotransferase